MNDKFLASKATQVSSRCFYQAETPVTFTCLPSALQATRPFRYPANIPGYATFLRLHKPPDNPTLCILAYITEVLFIAGLPDFD
jgi:hypothetical protein